MQAKFTQGSIARHIHVMTLSSTIGLLSLFLVDLADVYFLNLLGQIEITAALGFAGSILFFTIAIGIGLSIGCGAVVSQIIGRGDKAAARRLIAHSFTAILAITIVFITMLIAATPYILSWLGATLEAKHFAQSYILIILPSMPLMAIAMACGGVIRALGEAKSAMLLTLFGAGVNAVLDPIFIFVFDWGIEGAAIATVCSRIAMFAYGMWVLTKRHDMLGKLDLRFIKSDLKRFLNIAFPAMLTNLSTPIGFAFITSVMATFGNEAVAGGAMVGRIQSVTFAGLFALSASIGPITGQNLGASFFDRIYETLEQSLYFVAIYCAAACGLLWILSDGLIWVFQAQGDAAAVIRWFCYGFSLTFLFNGSTFVCNAMLNNLHAAHVSTQFNFAKATLGTMPFVYYGAQWGGLIGIFWGTLIGAAIIAALGVWFTHRHIGRLQLKAQLETTAKA